jgi:cobalt-zinc-cadmium resistance protein CzcA
VFIVGIACLLAIGGLVAYRAIPVDAFPDVTNVQMQVLTNASGLSPVEVERFVTMPLEIQLTGLPGLAEIRSLSKFALSQITVVFPGTTWTCILPGNWCWSGCWRRASACRLVSSR